VVAEQLPSDPSSKPHPSKGKKPPKKSKTEEEGERSAGEGVPRYLIKWAGLPYEEASWEVAADVEGPDFERELAKMRARVPICQGGDAQVRPA